jgi:hypothetical protein
MPLKMRPTGLGHGVYKDVPDYGCGEWCIGRVARFDDQRSSPLRSVAPEIKVWRVQTNF